MVPTMSVPQDYGTKRCSALQVSDDGPVVARRVSADLGEEKSILIPWHLGGSGHRASPTRNKMDTVLTP